MTFALSVDAASDEQLTTNAIPLNSYLEGRKTSMKPNPKNTDPPSAPGTTEFLPTAPAIEQQRDRLAELLAHLLVRHWLRHGKVKATVSSKKQESVGDQTKALGGNDNAFPQLPRPETSPNRPTGTS